MTISTLASHLSECSQLAHAVYHNRESVSPGAYRRLLENGALAQETRDALRYGKYTADLTGARITGIREHVSAQDLCFHTTVSMVDVRLIERGLCVALAQIELTIVSRSRIPLNRSILGDTVATFLMDANGNQMGVALSRKGGKPLEHVFEAKNFAFDVEVVWEEMRPSPEVQPLHAALLQRVDISRDVQAGVLGAQTQLAAFAQHPLVQATAVDGTQGVPLSIAGRPLAVYVATKDGLVHTHIGCFVRHDESGILDYVGIEMTSTQDLPQIEQLRSGYIPAHGWLWDAEKNQVGFVVVDPTGTRYALSYALQHVEVSVKQITGRYLELATGFKSGQILFPTEVHHD